MDSNFVRMAYVRETTIGTPPGSTVYNIARITGESLNFNISNIRSEELRTDRMVDDLIQTGASEVGGVQFELSFPEQGTFLGDLLELSLFNAWTNTPRSYNVTADSTIVSVGATLDQYGLASGGASYVSGMLVKAEGFTNSGNNQVAKVTSSSATFITVSGTTLTNEAAPPAGAQLKVVGLQGSAGGITSSTANSVYTIGSTELDFTTFGLQAGQWIKIGGTGSGNRFGTSANNGWARIKSVAAAAITLDRVPTGFATDTGATKTIKIWFGDFNKNGTTSYGWSIEKAFTAQGTPSYALYPGCMVNNLSLSLQAASPLSGSVDFLGRSGHTIGTSANGSSYTAATSHKIMNAVNNVAEISEYGAAIASPNFCRQLDLSIANNLRERTAIGVLGSVGTGVGDVDVTGTLTSYFGSKDQYSRYVDDTETNIAFRVVRESKALITNLPRVEFESGQIVASGRNQDVMAQMGYRALRHTDSSLMVSMDRLWYYED